MWIVRLALDKPYTFVVVAVLILLLGVFAIQSTPTDIFPKIDIPVVTIIWSYQGLPTSEMEKRITTFSELVLATINDIRSIESQTLNGVATIKVYFHPQVRIDAAMAQINSAVSGIRFRLPPGINPPWIFRFGADTVPVIQLALSSNTLSESELYDYGIFRVRQQLSTVAGTLLPAPYGGKVRQIMVDLDQDALMAKGLSPIDVSNAINSQNVTLPSGSLKIADREYSVSTNSSPAKVAEMNDMPIKVSFPIRKRRVDIGSSVKAGQVMAVIESPELDQEVEQAKEAVESPAWKPLLKREFPVTMREVKRVELLR